MRNFNEKLFVKGQTVAVALSGGEDSVCLFHFLLTNANSLGIFVKAVNVDHGIRGENSASDSEFVKRLCEKHNVELFFKKVDSLAYSATFGVSTEEAARILRYGVFNEAISSGFCDTVATAHHLSDNAETVLFNLFRGSASLGGINDFALNGKIIRPLLKVSKDDINRYVKENNLEFVTDETNSDLSYTRNFIRREVLPLIKRKFPSVENSLNRFSEISFAESEYLNSVANEYLIKNENEVSVLLSAPEVVFKRALAIALKTAGIVKDYEKRHIDLLLSLQNEKNGTTIDLPQGVKAVKDYDKITLYKQINTAEKPTIPYSTGKSVFGDKTIEVTPVDKMVKGDGFLYADGDKIPTTSVFRTRKEGDEFIKFGGKRKKLKDYLIDKKIPVRERDGLILLADGKEILAILKVEISDLIKVDKTTLKVVQLKTSNVSSNKGEDK